MNMNEIDALIKEKIVPMRNRVVEGIGQKHPHIQGVVENLTGTDKELGVQVAENGRTVGEYTFHLSGMKVIDVECGVLAPEVHLPMGIVRPYRIIEKSVLERALNDEQDFINEPFKTMQKYLPDITIKFQ
ncbi:MAG: hypothetical protein P4L69_06125 [Desulfosporosinus sp.]|nr:hypothetical protein [Desulfosporosinus sp.]